jgi:hypothetical protein
MPVNDWTRVSAGTFHDFHCSWIIHLKEAMNAGLLPAGYYTQAEQHAGLVIADILTLRSDERDPLDLRAKSRVAVAEPAPRVGRKMVANPIAAYRTLRRTIAIRHTSGHYLIALVEIVSPSNTDRQTSLRDFTEKAHAAIDRGIHVLVIDILPPARHEPRGIHAVIWETFDSEMYCAPVDKPLSLVSYAAYAVPEAYVAPIAVGDILPDMPVFIENGHYVNVPLEKTYLEAYRGVPAVWQNVIDGCSGAAES